MSSSAESITTPLARGLIAALLALGTVLALVVVPALGAQLVATRSTMTVLDAIVIAMNVLVLGHGGGIVLTTGSLDGAVTLTPLGLTALLVLVSALGMRRAGEHLDLTGADGTLRPYALRDAGAALGAYTLVYAAGMGLMAALGRSTDTSPVILSALVSGAFVALLGGIAGVLWSLRRPPEGSIPGVRILDLFPAPYGAIARACAVALLGFVGLGMGTVSVLLALHVPEAAALMDGLEPGIVGGMVLFLVQLALLPLLGVWALVVLFGGSVTLGTGTVFSLEVARTGVMPALPLFAVLPQPGVHNPWFSALMLLPALAVAAGAVCLVRDVKELGRREQVIAWCGYPLAVIIAVLVVAGLSTGGFAQGRFVHVGPRMDSLLVPLIGIVVVSTGLVLAVMVTPLIPWLRGGVDDIRERVEAEEAYERTGEDPAARRAAKQRLAALKAAAAGQSAQPASHATSTEENVTAEDAEQADDGVQPEDAEQADDAAQPEDAVHPDDAEPAEDAVQAEDSVQAGSAQPADDPESEDGLSHRTDR